MSGLFRFIAKLIGADRSSGVANKPATTRKDTDRVPLSPDARPSESLGLDARLDGRSAATPPPPALPPALKSPEPSAAVEPRPELDIVLIDVAEGEDLAEEEDDSAEPDPTIGRYEELHVAILDADEIGAQRAAAEVEGLAGPHKIFPHDPAGPGSLAETLAKLEVEGRVTSRICDDADVGFYVLYEPAPQP